MESVISESAGFKYTAAIDHVEATPGSYALTISTTYDQARRPTEARTAFKLTLTTEGLQALGALIDARLQDERTKARQYKDCVAVKIRNCEFSYRCTKTWEDLEQISEPKVRHCDDCGKSVFMCATDTELVEAIRNNRCVAVETETTDNGVFMLGLPKPRDWVPATED